MKPLATESIFVVDDDEDDCFLIREVFKHTLPRFRLNCMANGHELLRTLEASDDLPSLILLDLNMTKMGGIEVLRFLRQQTRYDGIPIVILTTSDQASDRRESLAFKANGFSTKPTTTKEFEQLALQLHEAYLV